MDTMNEVMSDLLIDQEDRISQPVGKISFWYIANKAEKAIAKGLEGNSDANKN